MRGTFEERVNIIGTLEHEEFLDYASYSGWLSVPSFADQLRQQWCNHQFTLWCTNKGIDDVFPCKWHYCKKCNKFEKLQEHRHD